MREEPANLPLFLCLCCPLLTGDSLEDPHSPCGAAPVPGGILQLIQGCIFDLGSQLCPYLRLAV